LWALWGPQTKGFTRGRTEKIKEEEEK